MAVEKEQLVEMLIKCNRLLSFYSAREYKATSAKQIQQETYGK